MPKELAEESLCEGLMIQKEQPFVGGGGQYFDYLFFKTKSNADAVLRSFTTI